MKNIKQILTIVIVLIAILVCEEILCFSTLGHTNMASKVRCYSQLISIVFCVIFSFLYMNKNEISKVSLLELLFLCSSVIVTMNFNNDCDNYLVYFYQILIWLFAFILLNTIPLQRIFSIFSGTAFFIGCFSFVFYIINLIYPSAFSGFPIITNSVERSFYFCVLTNIPTNILWYTRNWGPFREPGVFQMYLNFALIYYLFIQKEKKIYKILLMQVFVISTMSTTGVFVLTLIDIAYFFEKFATNKVKLLAILVGICCSIFVLVTYKNDKLVEDDNLIFGKFNRGIYSSSVLARYSSVTTNVFMFFDSPIWGNGISKVKNNFFIYTKAFWGRGDSNNTNHILYLLSVYGLFVFVLYIYKIIVFFFCYLQCSKLCSIILMLSFMVMMAGEIVPFSVFFSMFFFFNKRLVVETEKKYLHGFISCLWSRNG